MKTRFLIFTFLIFSTGLFAQQTYTENGQTYELKTEVDGTLDLLWTTINNTYRYFIRQDATLTELKNTKTADKKYQEEYKPLLTTITGNNADKVKLTLGSLRDFINDYNKLEDANYEAAFKRGKLKTRVGLFGGVTNLPFVDNPDNKTSTLFFGELEIYDNIKLKNHSLFFRAKHVLENDELKYSTTQLGLGYRFKFINTPAFNLHANVTFATLNFANATVASVIDDEIVVREESATSFDVPLIFGIGADIRINDHSFITIDYDELFAAFLDNQGNFSTHISLGYKFNL